MRDARKTQAQAARRQGVKVLVLGLAAEDSTIPNGRFHRLLIGDPVRIQMSAVELCLVCLYCSCRVVVEVWSQAKSL